MLRFVKATEHCCECDQPIPTCCSVWFHAFLPNGSDEIICGQCAMELEEQSRGTMAKVMSKFPSEDAKYDTLSDTEVFLYSEFLDEQVRKGNVTERP